MDNEIIISEDTNINTQNNTTEDVSMDEDTSIKRRNYEPSEFIQRGCCQCPTAYTPISKKELNSCSKLNVHNWISKINIPFHEDVFKFVEVRFKSSHKAFFHVPDGLELTEGDVVTVEGTPGHDIGIVTLCGELCRIQMKRKRVSTNGDKIKKLYRRATATDIEKWANAMRREDSAISQTRTLVRQFNLDMKINDVEYQGDDSKAIFYYTADDRVDFRQLIKALADVFHVKIEMKQIGARQEASKLGGIGTCGRELCCCTWMNNFHSVNTAVARTQQIMSNPSKLTGQCGKLKCCLNYEYDVYADALEEFPKESISLYTDKGKANYVKMDVFRKLMWYSYADSQRIVPLHLKDVRFIIDKNKKNQKVKDLESFEVKFDTPKTIQE
ncbi:MAG: hypothetical protein LBL74_06160 [Bacteroidales bacterium]|jgi:cell fate regulator YaaT (PSP1 superfamily)|nr:hypothetical protein [Bacteroidales bacterium]